MSKVVKAEDAIKVYVDWIYDLCNYLEGDDLLSYAEDFISRHTSEALSELFGKEVSEDVVKKARETYASVKSRLIVYCCGDPILNGFDKKYTDVLDKVAYDIISNTYPEDFEEH